jgi:tetratricopeptide (TPR) repeat protein
MIKEKGNVNVAKFLTFLSALLMIAMVAQGHWKTKDDVTKFLSKNDSPQAFEKVGVYYAKDKKWADAVHYLEIAKERDPKNAGILFKLAVAYHQNKRANESIEMFRAALKINPKSKATIIALGEVLEYENDAYDARLVYEEGCLKCKSCGHSKCG